MNEDMCDVPESHEEQEFDAAWRNYHQTVFLPMMRAWDERDAMLARAVSLDLHAGEL